MIRKTKHPTGYRTCTKCKLNKEEVNFYRKKNGYYLSRCKQCTMEDNSAYRSKNIGRTLELQRLWRKANPEKTSENSYRHSLKKKYGLTLEQYREMLQDQNGCCSLCEEAFTERKLFVDHSHSSGKVRSLLCSNCNSGLGFFKDNSDILNKAARYIECHRAA